MLMNDLYRFYIYHCHFSDNDKYIFEQKKPVNDVTGFLGCSIDE